MSTLVYMKMLERAPANYDRGMRLLTLGRVDRIKREIASAWVAPGHDVLEIGCGAGSLTALLTKRGARVVGIPATPEREQMVKQVALTKLPEMRRQLKQLQAAVRELAKRNGAAGQEATEA